MQRMLILVLLVSILAGCGSVAPQLAPDAPAALPNTGPQATATRDFFAPLPTQTPTTTVTPTPDAAALIAFDRAAKLGRGINLGNALEAPYEGAWGVTLREDFFTTIKRMGFDTVRVPIKWDAHTGEEPPYTIDPAFFQRVDWVLAQAEANQLNAIVDLHHFDGYMTDAAGSTPRLMAMWKQIAERYKDAPSSVYFELLNEPNNQVVPAVWNQTIADLITLVRASNPDRTLIVGPVWWNSVDHLKELSLPEQERNLIVTIHFYEPLEFTHQGAEFMPGAEAWLGTPWTSTTSEQNAISARFYDAQEWAKQHNRPIFLGEFGSYYKADPVSRVLWTTFVARQAESRSMSWAYWDFTSGFGVYNQDTGETYDALLKALIP